jgi:hypothetical protein
VNVRGPLRLADMTVQRQTPPLVGDAVRPAQLRRARTSAGLIPDRDDIAPHGLLLATVDYCWQLFMHKVARRAINRPQRFFSGSAEFCWRVSWLSPTAPGQASARLRPEILILPRPGTKATRRSRQQGGGSPVPLRPWAQGCPGGRL